MLAELAYRWWCPPGGTVLDPFAGGSVRGVVAGRLGLGYTGVDLREDQIAANAEQARQIGPGPDGVVPQWIQGDARDINDAWPPAPPFDLLVTWPPYFDLEQYSDDPRSAGPPPSIARPHRPSPPGGNWWPAVR